jgi:hypothetical protein
MYPVLIATKGRAGQSKAITALINERIEHYLFVEPQEMSTYAAAYPETQFQERLIGLTENDKGITFARRACLQYARARQFHWFWMMDDDVSGMFLVKENKCVRAPFSVVLKGAEDALTVLPNLGIGALEYGQYAWASKKDYAMNSYCDVAVLINVPRTMAINYRENCKEDRDFVLQALQLGLQSARASRFAFSAPKNGSNKGGLHDAYKAGLENHWSKRMVELWPGICEHHVKKDGRPDVKIKWRALKT